MPFVPVLNTALVETRMLFDGQKCENTLWVENETAWDETSLAELAQEVKDWWVANYAFLVSTNVTLREVVATDMTSATSAQATIDGGAEEGQVGDLPFPNNVTFTISFRTAARGRGFRGRNYIVGISTSNGLGINTLEAPYIANLISAYEALMGVISTAGWTWVVASRFLGVDPDTGHAIPRTAGVTTPITSVVATDNIMDSQRRRLPGRGQ